MNRIIAGSVFLIVAVLLVGVSTVSAQKIKKSDTPVGQASLAPGSGSSSVAAPQAVALMIEDFNYPTGTLTAVSGGNWVNFSGTGAFIQVSSGSLPFSGYPSSGPGNKIDIVSIGTSAEDAYRQFATQTAGTTVYGAFLVNVANVTGIAANSSTTGDYLAGFLPSSSTTALNARVSVRLGSDPSKYQLGLRATSSNSSAVFSNTDLAPGTTHLVVLSYQIVAGNSNDVINMWIDPVLNGTEPAPTVTQTTATTTDNADVSRFFVRQGTTTTPNASIDDIRVGNSWTSVTQTATTLAGTLDFDGDARTDFGLSRGHNFNLEWWISFNTGGYMAAQWGTVNDEIAPADYDGDGKTDIAIWRPGPSNVAAFYILQSQTNTLKVELFGQNGDDPRTVRDYDGDGKADVSVYRQGTNPGDQSYFFYRGSLNNPNGNITYVPWGVNGDIETSGDFDGDGKGDFVVRRNIGGAAWFFLLESSGSVEYINWGLPTDGIVPCDFDGDGKSDFCVARVDANSNYNTYVLTRTGGGTGAAPIVFGNANLNDKAAFGDYDGDGKTDLGIWRPNADPAQNLFWIRLTSTGSLMVRQWGGDPTDRPLGEWNVTGG